MNASERIVVPGLPCTTNNGYSPCRGNGRARLYKTAEARAWQDAVMWAVREQQAKPAQTWKGRWVRLRMTWEMRRPLVIDWDGGIKLTCDAVAKALGFDDRWVRGGLVEKADAPEDRTVIVVEEAGTDEKATKARRQKGEERGHGSTNGTDGTEGTKGTEGTDGTGEKAPRARKGR